MAEVNLGKIKPLWRGNYTDGVTYRPLDFLKSGGVLYICTVEVQDVAPPNLSYYEAVVDDQLSSTVIYAIGQLAGGDSSKVGVISSGVVVDTLDWLVYPSDGRIYKNNSVTGTISGDFNPSTGVDTGLSGALIVNPAVTDARATEMEGDIAQNTSDIAQNTADIATNTADIATNTADIATNTADIATLNDAAGLSSSSVAGVVWNSEVDTYVRTGTLSNTQIQEKMKRCVLNTDGSVNYYLHPDDSTLKEDGITPSVLDGTDGNVMVEIPKFYFKYTVSGTNKKAEICETLVSGFAVHPAFIKDGVEVDFRYYRAYEGYNNGGTLLSRSGVTPTRSFTFPVGRTYAQANGSGWGLIDWNLLHAVQILYFIEYGDFNSQSLLGDGNSTGEDYGITTGQSNSVGNSSSGPNNDNTWMSYRGIENWYGDIWEMIDGINVQNRLVYLNQNLSTFASDVFTGDYVSTGISLPVASASYIKDINFSEDGFIPTLVGGSSGTFVTDGVWSTTGNTVVYFGGIAKHGALDGSFCLNSNTASGASIVNVGASVSF